MYRYTIYYALFVNYYAVCSSRQGYVPARFVKRTG